MLVLVRPGQHVHEVPALGHVVHVGGVGEVSSSLRLIHNKAQPSISQPLASPLYRSWRSDLIFFTVPESVLKNRRRIGSKLPRKKDPDQPPRRSSDPDQNSEIPQIWTDPDP